VISCCLPLTLIIACCFLLSCLLVLLTSRHPLCSFQIHSFSPTHPLPRTSVTTARLGLLTARLRQLSRLCGSGSEAEPISTASERLRAAKLSKNNVRQLAFDSRVSIVSGHISCTAFPSLFSSNLPYTLSL
jgi:hypothetical protein